MANWQSWHWKLPKLIVDSCAVVETRYMNIVPWLDGDYIYATDGRICSRVAATGEMIQALPPRSEKHPPPPASKLFKLDVMERWPCIDAPPVPRIMEVLVDDDDEVAVPAWWPVRLGDNSFFNSAYLSLLYASRAKLWIPPQRNVSMYFTAGEVEGLLMQVCPGDSKVASIHDFTSNHEVA